jgi:hypothetical protein
LTERFDSEYRIIREDQMKKIWVVWLLCAVVLLYGYHPALAASDPGGVFGLKWSQSIEDCKSAGVCSNDTIPVEDKLKDETILYGTQTETAGLPLLFSSLGFYKGKLYRAVMMVKPGESAASAFEALKKDLSAQYGSPNSQNLRSAVWSLGSTKVTLARGEKTCGVMVAHEPTYMTVAKLQGFPYYTPPPAQKKTKKK